MCPLKNDLEEEASGLQFSLDDTNTSGETIHHKKINHEIINDPELSMEDETAAQADNVLQDTLLPSTDNRIGVSTEDSIFVLKSLCRFFKNTVIVRILNILAPIFCALSVIGLFLHALRQNAQMVWSLCGLLLFLGLVCIILGRLMRRELERSKATVIVRFCPSNIELFLPDQVLGAFPESKRALLERSLPPFDAAAKDELLKLVLPFSSLLEQRYTEQERRTSLKFNLPAYDLCLTLEISDAQLTREERAALEKEIFNRTGRVLRELQNR